MCMCLGPSRIKLLLIVCSIYFHRTCIRVLGFQQDKSKNTKSKNHLKVHPETMGNCIVLWANLMEAGHWEHRVWRAQYRRNDADWKESFCEMKSAISGEKEAEPTQSQEKTQANFRVFLSVGWGQEAARRQGGSLVQPIFTMEQEHEVEVGGQGTTKALSILPPQPQRTWGARAISKWTHSTPSSLCTHALFQPFITGCQWVSLITHLKAKILAMV